MQVDSADTGRKEKVKPLVLGRGMRHLGPHVTGQSKPVAQPDVSEVKK